ncbi:VOC family protein [Streptomyces sp. NPDC058646]|uniref:VOC family protein n=1 Tax=Streptomyces sp. NPDC058646 TaxID=3346574 RepID=UPI0036471F65
MIAELQCVVLDCPDPLELAEFYRSLLGGAVNRQDRRWACDEDWATLHTPSGAVLAFQRVADYRPPRRPDPARPQQFHLDLEVADLDRAQEQALARGATVLDEGSAADAGAPAGEPTGEGPGEKPGEEPDGGSADRGWRVYADPAGHPFCLVRH